MGWSEDAAINRDYWDRTADSYTERNGAFIERGLAWGVWQISEAELDILGEVVGRDVLELVCGEAEWSRALARLGARPVGLDVSPRRIELAREALARDALDFPLIEAAAESVPLPDRSEDTEIARRFPLEQIWVLRRS
jgi:ubiquinone/menaquinone biosynthesis C-methylase UbiE